MYYTERGKRCLLIAAASLYLNGHPLKKKKKKMLSEKLLLTFCCCSIRLVLNFYISVWFTNSSSTQRIASGGHFHYAENHLPTPALPKGTIQLLLSQEILQHSGRHIPPGALLVWTASGRHYRPLKSHTNSLYPRAIMALNSFRP